MTPEELIHLLVERRVIRADWYDDYSTDDDIPPRVFQVKDTGCGCCSEVVNLPDDLTELILRAVGPDPYPNEENG